MWPRRAGRQDDVGALPAAAIEPRPAWGSVGLMQRTFDQPAMTMETFSFQAGLAAHTNPELLRPLDHGRSAGAPAGVIDGLLTPVLGPARAVGGGPELPLLRRRRPLRVQRRPAAGVAASPPPAAAPEALDQEPAWALPAVPEPQPADAPALTVVPRNDPPALRLPAVTTVQRAGDEAVPQGAEQQESTEVDIVEDTTPARTPPVEAASLSSPTSETPDSTFSVDTPPLLSPAGATDATGGHRRLPTGGHRRLGLGPPLRNVPAPPVLQRSEIEGGARQRVSQHPPAGADSAPPPLPTAGHRPDMNPSPTFRRSPEVSTGPETSLGLEVRSTPPVGPIPTVSRTPMERSRPEVDPVPVDSGASDPPVAMPTLGATPSGTQRQAVVPPPADNPTRFPARRSVASAPDDEPPLAPAPPAAAMRSQRDDVAPLLRPPAAGEPTSISRLAPEPAEAGPASANVVPPAARRSGTPSASRLSPAARVEPSDLPAPARRSVTQPGPPQRGAGVPPPPLGGAETPGTPAPVAPRPPDLPLLGESVLAAKGMPVVARHSADVPPASPAGPSQPAPTPAPPAVPSVPRLTVARDATALILDRWPQHPTDAGNAPLDDVQHWSPAHVPATGVALVQRRRTSSESPMLPVPLLGSPANAPIAGVQRAAAGPVPGMPSPQFLPRSTATAEGPTALRAQLPAPVHESGGSRPVTIARATPPPAETAAPAMPRPLQRLDLSAPVPAAAGATLAAADPAAAALASGLASRDTDGSVVFRTPEHLYPSASAAPEPVQRQPAGDADAPVPPAAVGSAGATSGAAEHVDELAKRVYDRISERLKSELRLDRERSGRLTDLSR